MPRLRRLRDEKRAMGTRMGIVMHHLIAVVPIPPRATAGHLLTLSVPAVGHSQFYRGLEAGHLRTRGDPRAFDTCVFKIHWQRRGGC